MSQENLVRGVRYPISLPSARARQRRTLDERLFVRFPAPGMDAVVYGHDGYRRVWAEMVDAFEDFHAEPEEIFDLGDMLLATTRYGGHGSGSGVPIKLPLVQLLRLRRGLVVWQQDFSDRSEALEVAAQRE